MSRIGLKRNALPSTGIALRHIPLLCWLMASVALLAVRCGGETPPTSTFTIAPKVQVVATTSILADLVINVGGDRIEVHTIVPPGANAHSFQTTPQDSIAVSKAGLIISNGFGLDDFLEPVLRGASGAGSIHVVAAQGLQPAQHSGAEGDPHFWQNPLHVVHYVERIRDGLIQADPPGSQEYQANTAIYIQKLYDLDEEITRTLEDIPIARRHLVTFHNSFGYFAERYGWGVYAFVPSDATDVTPRAVTAVLERVQQDGILAVFAEPQFGSDVLSQAAKDAGVSVGVIYSDALDANAPTYIDMMRFNARSLVEHLR